MVVDPLTQIVGGIAGAIVAAIVGAPHRDSKGQYQTRGKGLVNWIITIIVGGVLGTIIARPFFGLYESNPIIGFMILAVVSYIVYVNLIDPR